MKKSGKIYIITNNLNKQQYVGFTTTTIKKRFRQHCNDAKYKQDCTMPIVTAIRKHGTEHFQIEQLFEHADAEFVLTHMEPYYIHKHDTYNSGYNACKGGRGSLGSKWNKDSKLEASMTHTGKLFTDDHKKALSDSSKGREISKSHKKTISRANEQYVYKIIDPKGNEHNTTNLNQFCKDNSINQSNMHNVMTGKKKSYKGYTGKRVERIKSYSKKIKVIPIEHGVSAKHIHKEWREFSGDYIIFSDEMEDRKEIIESFTGNSCYSNNKIHGRKTTARKISNAVARAFINNNHIQPITKCAIAYGLFDSNDSLVSVVTFSHHHRGTSDKNHIVLSRFCTLLNTHVHGAFTKLLKLAVKENAKWEKIITWSDNRFSVGKMYNKCGFSKDTTLQQDYSYYCPASKKRYNKQKFMKSKIECKDGQTERERMEELGYKRVYDLGKIRWTYDIEATVDLRKEPAYGTKTAIIPHNKLSIPPKEELIDLYINKKNTITKIAKHYKVSNPTASNWLDHHDIPKRSHSDNIKIAMDRSENLKGNAHISDHTLSILDSQDLLEKEFISTGYNRYQLAKHLKVSASTIDKRLYKYGISDKYTFTNQSTDEQDVADFIIENAPELSVIRNTRKICPPKEIDIYIPEKNLAIEYCGLYYHTYNTGGKNRTYHQNKMIECGKRGVRLITIFSNEWGQKREICESRILSAIGKTPERIHARKCEVRKIARDGFLFFTENHIQGGCGASVCYGLYHNEELVAAMSFGKPRFNKSYEHELLRFANRLNTTVVGGASKLFSAFIKEHSSKSILSYCDLRWGTGGVYEQLGFDCKTQYTSPNYFYTKSHATLESRNKYQKKKLPKLLSSFDESLSERQNMFANGYDMIYDCGNSVFGIR